MRKPITIILMFVSIVVFLVIGCQKDKEEADDPDVNNACDGQSILSYAGQDYKIVGIGDQCWMAANFNYETPNSWCYDDSIGNCDIYGRLYNWDAAFNACPNGWHLPSDEEWKTMEMELGMSQAGADSAVWRGTDEGNKMKETGTIHWDSPNEATNSSGFSALGGGNAHRNPHFGTGSFSGLRLSARFWTRTESSDGSGWARQLWNGGGEVQRVSRDKQVYGMSVRCVKD